MKGLAADAANQLRRVDLVLGIVERLYGIEVDATNEKICGLDTDTTKKLIEKMGNDDAAAVARVLLSGVRGDSDEGRGSDTDDASDAAEQATRQSTGTRHEYTDAEWASFVERGHLVAVFAPYLKDQWFNSLDGCRQSSPRSCGSASRVGRRSTMG